MAGLDAYGRVARFYPAVVTALPTIALVAVLVPWNKLGFPQALATGATAVALVVLSDIARRSGRAIEPRIIHRMGGLPSITMMRYADNTFDAAAKFRIHTFVATKIGAVPPAQPTEQSDPADADTFYKRCSDWLRENTRDTKRFKILFEENKIYGFRRNLLGLKWIGLTLSAITILFCAGFLCFEMPIDLHSHVSQKLSAVIAIAFVQAAYFLFFVNEAAVIEAARQYARQLLLCCETL